VRLFVFVGYGKDGSGGKSVEWVEGVAGAVSSSSGVFKGALSLESCSDTASRTFFAIITIMG